MHPFREKTVRDLVDNLIHDYDFLIRFTISQFVSRYSITTKRSTTAMYVFEYNIQVGSQFWEITIRDKTKVCY